VINNGKLTRKFRKCLRIFVKVASLKNWRFLAGIACISDACCGTREHLSQKIRLRPLK
jgi:hypothetical protein